MMLTRTFFLDLPDGAEDAIEHTGPVFFLSFSGLYQDVLPDVLS